MKVFVDEHPQWLDWIAPEKFNDADLYKIVTFYVFQSPCPDLSARCKTLYDYGWSNPWSKPYYLNRQLKQKATNFELYYSASTHDDMDQALKRAHLDVFPPVDEDGNFDSTERLCFYDCKKNQSMSVFYHIRNMLAHCRLNMVDVNGSCVFVMEDVGRKDKNGKKLLTARMVIRKETLLSWISLVEGKEQEYIKYAK